MHLFNFVLDCSHRFVRLYGDGGRMADAWPQLLESPIITEWQWSELARSGVEQTRALIHPDIVKNDRHRGELKGLLALHVRRGDFKPHCEHMAKWRLPYNAWNVRPDFPDVYDPPAGGGNGQATPELLAYYFHHCYPEIDEMIKRVEDVISDARKQGRTLDRLYVLTNGSNEWLEELKAALKGIAKWKSLTTSRDLSLTKEQKYIAQVLDQIIATRAEVFLGNAVGSPFFV